MTGELLQSDIDLARRMINAKNPDPEIITALIRRGIATAKAEELVQALRSGTSIPLRAAIVSEISPREGPLSKGAYSGTGESPPASRGRKSPRRDSSAEAPKSSSLSWFRAAVFVGLGVAAGIAIATRLQHPKSESPGTTVARGAQAATDKSRPKVSPASLALSIQQDGLRIGGLLVTHDNALKTISGLIGAPNRTNELEEPGKVLYAYDSHGLLIYSQKGVRDEHIVLHLEAIGGAKGTTAPFAGTLKIDDSIINADTDAQTLTSIKSLGLEPPREDKHVFGGQYNGLELYFTFFETTQHLSLIEVKLK